LSALSDFMKEKSFFGFDCLLKLWSLAAYYLTGNMQMLHQQTNKVKKNAVNYRPISLTCISCKIMKHVITKHILNHLENNSLLYDLQHGFRYSRSCETQLLSLGQWLYVGWCC
jgi:hypothetical protein